VQKAVRKTSTHSVTLMPFAFACSTGKVLISLVNAQTMIELLNCWEFKVFKIIDINMEKDQRT